MGAAKLSLEAGDVCRIGGGSLGLDARRGVKGLGIEIPQRFSSGPFPMQVDRGVAKKRLQVRSVFPRIPVSHAPGSQLFGGESAPLPPSGRGRKQTLRVPADLTRSARNAQSSCSLANKRAAVAPMLMKLRIGSADEAQVHLFGDTPTDLLKTRPAGGDRDAFPKLGCQQRAHRQSTHRRTLAPALGGHVVSARSPPPPRMFWSPRLGAVAG